MNNGNLINKDIIGRNIGPIYPELYWGFLGNWGWLDASNSQTIGSLDSHHRGRDVVILHYGLK
ncbi:hypothetical protein [Rhizobium leguminosarum]|uniref:hypothetical protein n=1 Tax=Rhizobium leguminosarum TaxID=384 RepID=UPI001C9449D0|nr:hypothetical protein [Rhizobium leguminosarum]MBY5338331.1 hypothetical protein [Rhizobium leguminosarum]MBY5347416.1 hypothetical protein [Rhizobium leguminosarum]MBY5359171.1 hypothetical protein [Rhizobium leguminosarum]